MQRACPRCHTPMVSSKHEETEKLGTCTHMKIVQQEECFVCGVVIQMHIPFVILPEGIHPPT